jgi:hypothetical protein
MSVQVETLRAWFPSRQIGEGEDSEEPEEKGTQLMIYHDIDS